MLTSSGVNTFGTPTDYSNIIITPYCFKKGSTSAAIYGVSHFHSTKDLMKLIENGGLTFEDVDERQGFRDHRKHIEHKNHIISVISESGLVRGGHQTSASL